MTATETPGQAAGFRAEDVVKTFAGVPALSGVSVALRPGQVVGLVGHNGAGKSTLLKALAGVHRPDSGRLVLDGRAVHFSSPAEALSLGVATVYQELSLLPNLTVSQNIWLGRELTGPGGLRMAEMRRRSQALVDEFGLDVDVATALGHYPVATRQLLEIAVAAAKHAKYLLLDEPTTSLEGKQVDDLLQYLRTLVRKSGVGILIVDHKLDELYQICDRIVALVDGRVRIDADAGRVPHEEVVQAIVGDEDEAVPVDVPAVRVSSAAPSQVALSAADVHGPSLHGVTLEARSGQVLGLYGLIGSGRTEFLRSLIGMEPITAGRLELFGQRYAPRSVAAAMRRGVAYLTEERQPDGIVPGMDSSLHAALPVVGRYARGGWLKLSRLRCETRVLLDRMRIKGDLTGPIEALSGGNQQKVLLARAIAQRPRLLLLDEPTKGVDIGVKAEIHQMLRQMADAENIALIVASSEEEEILDVSDTVAVFVNGRTVGPALPVDEVGVSDLRRMAWGGRAAERG